MPRPYKAILFDMGYTLVTFDPPVLEIVQRALAQLGVERQREQIVEADRAVWGPYYANAGQEVFPATPEYDAQVQRGLSSQILNHLGVDPHCVDEYRAAMDAIFRGERAVQLYPDTLSTLDALAEQKYRLGIISNWSWNLRQWVRDVGLDGRFEVVWASAYAGCNKPHPGIFHQVLLQLELEPADALYVGDSYDHDVVGAQGVGMDVVWVNRASGLDDDPWMSRAGSDDPAVSTIAQLSDLLSLVGTDDD
jgi:HAD superfamily hydrolase (TIGR01662 family)